MSDPTLPPSDDLSFVGQQNWSRRVGAYSLACWFSRNEHYATAAHGHWAPHLMLYLGGLFTTEAHDGVVEPQCPLVFNPAQTYHRDRPLAGGGSFFTISLHEESVASALDLPVAPSVVHSVMARTMAEQVLRSIRSAAGDALDLEVACHELWSSLGGKNLDERAPPAWLASTSECLLDEVSVTIREVAAMAGVDPAHYVRTFRKFHGCPPGEWRRVIRLRRAASALSTSRRSLVEVAISSGFADQSHFTKAFRHWIGVSPGRYRTLTS